MSLQLQKLEPHDGLPLCDESLSLEGLQLLVVDDDPDTRELLTFIFAESGAEVTAVASVSAALEALKRSKPDVLISDIKLPDEDGYALICKVRNWEAGQAGRIPAIALTAYAGQKNCKRALSEGFDRYLSKPVEVEKLTMVVANLALRMRLSGRPNASGLEDCSFNVS